MSYLEVRDLVVAYGAIQAVRGVSFDVEKGQIVSLIGSNGAGKTTTLRTISGLLRAVSGEVLLDGEPIHRLPAHEILAKGVAHSPEGRKLFSRMTVEENLRLGAYARRDEAAVEADFETMLSFFPILATKRRDRGGSLSGGQQQMLAIARGLMTRPRVLLLDEPSLGLSPLLVKEIKAIILDIGARFGASVLLVEQNAGLALAVASRGYLMQNGRIVVSGPIAELRDMSLMRELYLGGVAGAPA